jgi:hypothetical protein
MGQVDKSSIFHSLPMSRTILGAVPYLNTQLQGNDLYDIRCTSRINKSMKEKGVETKCDIDTDRKEEIDTKIAETRADGVCIGKVSCIVNKDGNIEHTVVGDIVVIDGREIKGESLTDSQLRVLNWFKNNSKKITLKNGIEFYEIDFPASYMYTPMSCFDGFNCQSFALDFHNNPAEIIRIISDEEVDRTEDEDYRYINEIKPVEHSAKWTSRQSTLSTTGNALKEIGSNMLQCVGSMCSVRRRGGKRSYRKKINKKEEKKQVNN